MSRGTWESEAEAWFLSPTGLSPAAVHLSRVVRLGTRFVTSVRRCDTGTSDPTTPTAQRPQAWHAIGLGCLPFARRYSGDRMLLSFPEATEMFQFASLAAHRYGFTVR